MDRIQSWTEKICGRAVPPVARGNDLADGTLNKANIHKLNGNALKISRHKPASLLSDKMRGRGICSRSCCLAALKRVIAPQTRHPLPPAARAIFCTVSSDRSQILSRGPDANSLMQLLLFKIMGRQKIREQKTV